MHNPTARRRFLKWTLALGGAAMLGESRGLSRAQQKEVRLTMITWRGETEAEKGFKDELGKSAYAIKYTSFDAAQNKQKLTEFIGRINPAQTDLIYTFGTTVTEETMKKIKDTPIIFTAVAWPDRVGIVNNMSGSGTNVCGVTQIVPMEDQLKALREIIKIRKMGIIYNPRENNAVASRDILKELALRQNFTLIESPIEDSAKIKEAAAVIIREKVNAVYLPPDSLVITKGQEIVELFNQAKIPTLASLEGLVMKHNALIGFVTSYFRVGQMAAQLAVRILKGEKPGGLPVDRPPIEYAVNLKTAKRIGVKVPLGIVSIATKVIK